MSARHVLIVDDDASVREALAQSLDLADLAPLPVSSVIEAKDHVCPDFPGVVLTDLRMPGRDGFALLDHIRGVDADLPVILLTGHGDVPLAVQAMSAGAFDFLEKPCANTQLVAVLTRALEARSIVLEERRVRAARDRGDAAARLIFGTSDLAEDLRDQVRRAARARAEVLVTGPPGSGIPKVAEVIHLVSPAARHPFVKRSAATLDPDTLSTAPDSAGGGTLFLDEAARLPDATQFALLGRLDGGMAARVIAGVTGDLTETVTAGTMLADLAMRLDVMRVEIPSLAARREDIPVMFRLYVAQACEQADLPEPEVSPETVARLMAQDWPGNARSLMNAAMRFAMGLGEGERASDKGLAEQLADVERSLLIAALERAGGRAAFAAKALKLPRKTFYDKLARHGLRADRFRTNPRSDVPKRHRIARQISEKK